MKISTIELHLVDLSLRTPFTTSFGTYQSLERPFLVVRTEDGLTGVGEVPTLSDPAYKPEADPASVVTSLQQFILPAVANRQADMGSIGTVDDLRASYSWIKGAHFAKSGVEAALWDIEAQRARKPLWEFWGGTVREFAVGVSIGGSTVDEVLRRADNAATMGYKRLKVKIWPGFDVDVVSAIREKLPDIMLQVDANSAYTTNSWSPLKELDSFGLLLIEQPLYDDDIVLHSEISKEIETPICLDESIHTLRDAQAAIHLWNTNGIRERLIINVKPPRVSGFSEAKDIIDLCGDHDVRTWIGGMLDSAWGKAMNLNLNALETVDLPGDHFTPSGAYFEQDIVAEPLSAHEGLFALEDGVSTGVEFDWDAFESLGRKVYTQTFG